MKVHDLNQTKNERRKEGNLVYRPCVMIAFNLLNFSFILGEIHLLNGFLGAKNRELSDLFLYTCYEKNMNSLDDISCRWDKRIYFSVISLYIISVIYYISLV